ncbi:MAG TPA: FkbM family methyltransferase [Candidatus Eisenbacteria bacterium]|nr:FkbM family methyltransferase [Candidatus Eisenbacteria bacterium]
MALRRLPGGAPQALYTTVLRPPPLRAAANAVLRRILPALIELPEGPLALNPDDPVVSGALALGVYERTVTSCFRRALAPGMTVVDLGANLGYYSVIALGRTAPDGRLLAFEPDPANHALLVQNLARFGPRAIVRREAVADGEGTGTLHRHPDNKGKHSLLASDELGGGVPVTIVSLDAALAALAIARVDLVKMDIEGAEPRALAGMSETLARDRPLLFIECAPRRWAGAGHDTVAVLGGLVRRGYALTLIDEAREAEVAVTPEGVASLGGRDPYVNLIARPAGRTP